MKTVMGGDRMNRWIKIEKERSYGAVVINEKREFLLIKHRNGEHWDFPKGHKEDGESSEDTALREILEETGLETTIIDGFKERIKYSPRENVEKIVTFYFGFSMDNVTIQEKEVLDFGFFTYEKALEKITFNQSKEVIKLAKTFMDTYLDANRD